MTGPLLLPRSRMIALVAAGLLAGGAGGFVISQLGVATASSPSPTPSAGPAGPGHGRFGDDRPDGMGEPALLGLGGMGGMGRGEVLHGEATVAKPGGGTMTVRFVNGKISGISGSTVTVK